MTKSETLRRQWIAMLSVLVAPMDDAKATAALVKMLPMFQGFPDAAFSTASCEHVAGLCKRVPGYGELRERLGDWWKEHRPPPVDRDAIGLLTFESPSAVAERRASWDDPVAIRTSVRLVLSSPVQQEFLGKLLGKCVAMAAPQHLHNVPPEWHPA